MNRFLVLLILQIFLSGVAVAVVWGTAGETMGMGAVAGSVLALVNLVIMVWLVRRIQRDRIHFKWRVGLLAGLKLPFFLLISYGFIALLEVNIIGFAIGFFSLVLTLTIAGLMEARQQTP